MQSGREIMYAPPVKGKILHRHGNKVRSSPYKAKSIPDKVNSGLEIRYDPTPDKVKSSPDKVKSGLEIRYDPPKVSESLLPQIRCNLVGK